eukprot:m.132695 g.132695  ORF g.132695 m.132695 type:complete len:222 (-) comp13092_c0_seq13:123-788(-)
MPTMTTSPSLCLKTLMKTTIPFSSCKCTRFISLWLRPFPIYVPVLLLQTLCLMSSYHVEHYGHAKRIVRNGDSFPANIWYHNTTKALPKFDIPDPVKYDERTWEYVVYDGYLSSAIFLAMSFEEKARNSKNKQAFLTNMEYAYKVYSFWLEHIESKLGSSGIPAYWHKNFGIVANALFDETKQSQYLEARNREWLAYTTSGQQDDQIPAIKGMLRQSGVKI